MPGTTIPYIWTMCAIAETNCFMVSLSRAPERLENPGKDIDVPAETLRKCDIGLDSWLPIAEFTNAK